MLINRHLGFDKTEGQGVDGKQFARELFELDSYNPRIITIYVNSMGGDVENAFDIMNALDACKSYTKVVIAGFAYSSMGWAILPADEIEVKSYSTWMCHLPASSTSGETSKFVDMVTKSIVNILSTKSGKNGSPRKSEAEVLGLMRTKTYWNAQQMYDNGYATRVVNSETVEGSYQEYQRALNKEILPTEDLQTIKNTITMSFPKVCNRLKIADDSSENDMMQAIAGLENRASNFERERNEANEQLKAANDERLAATNKASTLEVEKASLEGKISGLDNSLKTVNSELETLKAENYALAQFKAEAEAKQKENDQKELELKATNMVQEHVLAGRIDEEQSAGWIKMACNNFDDTKIHLETMPSRRFLPKANNGGVQKGAPANDAFSQLKARNMSKESAS